LTLVINQSIVIHHEY